LDAKRSATAAIRARHLVWASSRPRSWPPRPPLQQLPLLLMLKQFLFEVALISGRPAPGLLAQDLRLLLGAGRACLTCTRMITIDQRPLLARQAPQSAPDRSRVAASLPSRLWSACRLRRAPSLLR
jgi:hypothetical protein